MGSDAPYILVVDDEQANLDMFVRLFDSDLPVLCALSGEKALALLAENEVAVLVSDQRMPGMTGIDLLAEAARRWPDVRRILLTAYSDREMLLDAIRRGHVHEYVLKPWDPDEVRLHLEAGIAAYQRARDLARAADERSRLRAEIDERLGVGTIVGLAPLADTIAKLAASTAPVLVRGETGTGKELVARAIHKKSVRSNGPFVRVACRAADPDLVRAIEGARGGTLFLDEVAELPAAAQATLLDVLDRPGGARIVAATREAIEEKTKAGAFREDLFFRLVVVPFKIPPLRERKGDIAELARHFVGTIGGGMGKDLELADAAIASLELYDWPGNVRELRNVIERACVLAEPKAVLEREDLLFDFATTIPAPDATASIFEEISAEEGQRVREALRQSGGNRARAARLLGIPRTTLNDRIRKLGIV